MASTAIRDQPSVAAAVRPKVGRDAWIMRAMILLIGCYLVVTLALPLYFLLSKSVRDSEGAFVGFANFAEYFATPALFQPIFNSLTVGVVTTAITVTLAFVYSYARTR
ncbi:MAG: putative 2-aminoethylphosphonate ABC transporter permease subunit, partial [Geminicoccaceae bacterium]